MKTALLALLAASLVFGLLLWGLLSVARQAEPPPRPAVSTCTPRFWTHYAGYWLLPLLLFAPGPLAFGWLLLKPDAEGFWPLALFALPCVPPVLWGCIYYGYWRHDRQRSLTVCWPEKQFVYTERGTVTMHSFADVAQLTYYRAKKDRGGSCIFYAELLLADGRCLLVTCLTGDPFAEIVPAARQAAVARWFPWLP